MGYGGRKNLHFNVSMDLGVHQVSLHISQKDLRLLITPLQFISSVSQHLHRQQRSSTHAKDTRHHS